MSELPRPVEADQKLANYIAMVIRNAIRDNIELLPKMVRFFDRPRKQT